MSRAILLRENDTVFVALKDLKKGESIDGITLKDDIPAGHKFSRFDVKPGESVIKYGAPIGTACKAVLKGEHIHSHNLKTALSENAQYSYNGCVPDVKPLADAAGRTFNGYRRTDNRVGIRNEIWIIPTVGCANRTAQRLAEEANKLYPLSDGFFAYTHPYGCSQLGSDAEATADFTAALAKHPNAGGALLVSLGCENNTRLVMEKALGDYNKTRVRFLCTQESADEIADGLNILKELFEAVKCDRRESVSISELTLGFKCGGSDGFSGITANPLCGNICDSLTLAGAKTLLTEVPEMFGAEQRLFERCVSQDVFSSAVKMAKSFKEYFVSHGQTVYENPSPGNKDGGITTLEEKSLGCITKGGLSAVTDVLPLYGTVKKPGLSLLWGPGNDIVSSSNLTAAGAVIILFTTGRGTPLGAPVPTLKISSNSELFRHKPNWIDFDAGALLDGAKPEELTAKLLDLILSVANGKQTVNEQNSYREIAIFKDGVTL